MFDATERHTGFTGTQRGMTVEQKEALCCLMRDLTGWWHHGDCVEADAESHKFAEAFGLSTAIHPPSNPAKRAYCRGTTIYPPRQYLARNRDIVDATSSLIAAPAEAVEQLRSGTWSTVRYARRLGRPVTIVLPDGRVVVEGTDV